MTNDIFGSHNNFLIDKLFMLKMYKSFIKDILIFEDVKP